MQKLLVLCRVPNRAPIMEILNQGLLNQIPA